MREYLYSPSHNRLVLSTCAAVLERAVQDPDLYDRMGTCTYSSPCITYLEDRGVVTFPDAPQLYRAESPSTLERKINELRG